MVNSRRYHSRWSGPSGFITPDKADSIQNGTRILPFHAAGFCSADLLLTA
jgi:hypothetical protein